MTSIRWDSWVAQDRLLKLTEENKELAKNLKKGKETDALRQRTISKGSAAAKKRVIGSELSSAQGSEERHSSLPASGRGQKRGRDFEIEKVRAFCSRFEGITVLESFPYTYFGYGTVLIDSIRDFLLFQ